MRFSLNITRVSGNLFDCYEINYVHCLFQSIAGPTDSIEPNQQQQHQQQTVSKLPIITGYFCSCQRLQNLEKPSKVDKNTLALISSKG